MPAVVDIRTSKIAGCKKETKDWWHEKGHLEFHKSEKGMKFGYFQESFFQLTLVFVVISLFVNEVKYAALITLALYIYFFSYEEFWCDKYAKEKMKGGGK